jgi:hypothetical protein
MKILYFILFISFSLTSNAQKHTVFYSKDTIRKYKSDPKNYFKFDPSLLTHQWFYLIDYPKSRELKRVVRYKYKVAYYDSVQLDGEIKNNYAKVPICFDN